MKLKMLLVLSMVGGYVFAQTYEHYQRVLSNKSLDLDVFVSDQEAFNNLAILELVLSGLGPDYSDLLQINLSKKKALAQFGRSKQPWEDLNWLRSSQFPSELFTKRVDSFYGLVRQMILEAKRYYDDNNAAVASLAGQDVIARLVYVSYPYRLNDWQTAKRNLQLSMQEEQGEIKRLKIQKEIAINKERSVKNLEKARAEMQKVRDRLKLDLEYQEQAIQEIAPWQQGDQQRRKNTEELNKALEVDPNSPAGQVALRGVRRLIERYDQDHSKYIFPLINDYNLDSWRQKLGELLLDDLVRVGEAKFSPEPLEPIMSAIPEIDDRGGFLESKSVSPVSADTTYPISPVSAILSDYEDPYGEYTLPDDLETKGEPAVLQDSKDEDFISANASPTLAVGFAQASPVLAAGFAEALPSHRAGGPACDIVVPANLVEFASNLGVSAMNGYLKANPNDLIGTLSRSEMDKRMLEVRAIIQRVDAYAAHNNGRTLLGLNRGDVERWRTYLNSSC